MSGAPRPEPDPLRPAVFFDRDGVINVSPGPGYVLTEADFHLMPGVGETMHLCRALGYATVLVTSQQGVGKGLMSMETLDGIHAGLQRALGSAGFTGIYACTHRDGTCTCRKPSPQMILQAAAEHGLDPARSIMVGDADRDMEMARRAGVPVCIFFAAEHGPGNSTPDHVVQSHAELQALLRDLAG